MNDDEQAPHRLFSAIVLMGTGLVLSCGGMAQASGSANEGGNEPGGGGGGGLSGSATTSTSGAPTSAVSGGAASLGGATSTNGGAGAAGVASTPVIAGPFLCPPQKWSCSSSHACGVNGDGWPLQDDCECDERRPLTADDCDAGLVFVCKRATSTADGRPLAQPVGMSCACVEPSVSFCSDECDRAYGARDLRCFGDPVAQTALCDCAIVLLK